MRRFLGQSPLLLWVTYGLSAPPFCESAPEGTTDEIKAKADFGAQTSVAGGPAAVDGAVPERRVVANRRHTRSHPSLESERDIAVGIFCLVPALSSIP